jgi:hypothetical protein
VLSGDDARTLLAHTEAFSHVHAYALAIASRVFLKTGDVVRAMASAREAEALRQSVGPILEGNFAIDVALALAVDASGDHDAARGVIESACLALSAQVARFSDQTWRKSFLENVPAHAEVMRLARAWDVTAMPG